MELVGGPYDGEEVATLPSGGTPYLYVAGCVRAERGSPAVVRVARVSLQPMTGVREQAIYARRQQPALHYRYMADLTDED